MPRELTILGVVSPDSPTSQAIAGVSDITLNPKGIDPGHPLEDLAGWLDLNLVRDPTDSSGQIHQQIGINVDLLGARYRSYHGLPALTLVLQEYLNNKLNPAGVYGGAVPSPYEVSYDLWS